MCVCVYISATSKRCAISENFSHSRLATYFNFSSTFYNITLFNEKNNIYTIKCILVANGVYQNTVYGMAAKLPFKYTGVVVLGSNISGTFAAVISILSDYFTSNTRTAAIYYFITALFVLLLCFDTYFALPLNVSNISTQFNNRYLLFFSPHYRDFIVITN